MRRPLYAATLIVGFATMLIALVLAMGNLSEALDRDDLARLVAQRSTELEMTQAETEELVAKAVRVEKQTRESERRVMDLEQQQERIVEEIDRLEQRLAGLQRR